MFTTNFCINLAILNTIQKKTKIIKEEAKQKYISKLKDENIQLIQQGRNLQMTNINSILEKIEYEEKDTESLIEIIYYKLLFKNLQLISA